MTTSDSFDPAQSLPRFLAESAGHEIDHAPDEAAARSPVLKAAILMTAVAVIGVAVMAIEHREALFANAPALLADTSPPQPAPAIQVAADTPTSVAPAADAQVAPPNPMDTPAGNKTAASEPAKDQAENGDVLFKQFQAWAAEQDAQPKPVQEALVRTAQGPPAPVPAVENARTPHRFAQKRRYTRVVRNARAEVRAQNLRKQVRRPQASRAERPAVQDARAQEQPVQNGQPSPFVFGARN